MIHDMAAETHKAATEPPPQSTDEYQSKGLLGADGMLALSYAAVENGGSMCVDEVSHEEHVVIGGMFFWERSDLSLIHI